MKRAIINFLILVLIAIICAVCYYAGHTEGYKQAQFDKAFMMWVPTLSL